VLDDLYRAVRPMLAVSNGRLICLSTPYGKRGFFHDAWTRGGADWARIEVPADRIAKVPAEILHCAVSPAAPTSASPARSIRPSAMAATTSSATRVTA
jgi:hypothetical protein